MAHVCKGDPTPRTTEAYNKMLAKTKTRRLMDDGMLYNNGWCTQESARRMHSAFMGDIDKLIERKARTSVTMEHAFGDIYYRPIADSEATD